MTMREVIEEYSGSVSSADELYSALFRIGDNFIEQTAGRNAPTTFKGNPIIYENDEPNYNGKWKRHILLEDTFFEQIHAAQKFPSNLLNACTYYGKKKDSKRMDKCFGLIFDIDNVRLNTLLHQCRGGLNAMPNYIVVSKSGKGVHLYYLFDRPLRMYPNIKIELKALKYEMTRSLWTGYTSENKNVQFQSYDQSFMLAETTEEMKVYKLNDKPWAIDELAEIYEYDFKWEKYKPTAYTKEEAREMFPEWYEKVVINGEKLSGRWVCHRGLYEWWLKKILKGAKYGNRYWCSMMLVIYAVKCDIPKREVKKELKELLPYFNTIETEHPFTMHDIESALDAYDDSFVSYSIDEIERHTQIRIDRNKRNGRSRAEHLKIMNAVRDIDHPNGSWRFTGSKPKHKEAVEQYFKDNPEASVSDCASDLNIARSTVYRWLKSQPKKV